MSFLKKIQNSNEATKKHWLVVSSAISIIIVLVLWLVYINWTISLVNNNNQKQELEPNFWQIFKTGLIVISESIWNNFKLFISKITGERVIVIE